MFLETLQQYGASSAIEDFYKALIVTEQTQIAQLLEVSTSVQSSLNNNSNL